MKINLTSTMSATLLAFAAFFMAGCSKPEQPKELPVDPVVEISEEADTETSVTVGFRPNSSAASFSYALGSEGDRAAFESGTIAGYTTVAAAEIRSVTFDGLAPGTSYTLFVRATSKSGIKGPVATFSCHTRGTANPAAPRCVGYIPTWAYDCYRTLDWNALTHLNIAFYYPDDAGNMGMPFGNDQILRDIVAKAHENGVKVLGSIRDCNPALFATSQARAGFISKIIAETEKFKLDGIDSDLEQSDPGFWPNYEKFITELNEKCDEKNLLLTTAVSTWFSNNITDKTFACFDFINIMAYDLGFSNHSSFEGMKAMAEHYKNIRRIPAGKIVCGVPFYGYDKNSTGWDDKNGEWFVSKAYREIIAADPAAANKDESNNIVYNGMPTIKRKSEFAQDYGGIMIWELSQDTNSSSYSLLSVIKKNLFSTGSAPRPVSN